MEDKQNSEKKISEIDNNITQPTEETENLNIFFNQDQFKIIKGYKKINRLLFKHGIYIFIMLLGGVATYLTSTYADQENTEINLSQNQNFLNRRKEKNIINNENNIDIIIPYGEIQQENEIFSSYSNLIKYEGIILPRIIQLDVNKEFFNIEKFNQGETNSGDLVALIEEIIMKPNAISVPPLNNNPRVMIREGIIEDFNLSCINKKKLSNTICDKYLERFYTYGILYNIQQHSSDLTNIMNYTKQNKSEKELCNILYENTLYQRENTEEINTIISQCPTENIQNYRILSNFITIEQEISNGIVSKKVYNNKDLNSYKLLSAQQVLYKSYLAGNINKNYITSYLDFVQELINKNNGEDRYLDPIYKDIIYRINNNLFLNKLEGNDNKNLNKTEINQIINQINLINKGNSALGVKGLEKQITTPDLIQYREIGEIEIKVTTIEELLQTILSLTNRMKVQQYRINQEDESTYIQTEILWEKIQETVGDTLKAKITLYRENDFLLIESIDLINQPELTEFLNIYITNNKLTLPQLFNIIDENIELYAKKVEKINICDYIRDILKENVNIISCNDNVVDAFKDGVNYIFTIENNNFKNIQVSDKQKEEDIKLALENYIINGDNIASIIVDILNKVEETPEQYVQEKVIIAERMKRYLNTTPKTEEISNTQFIVTFKLGEFTLRGTYDISTHTISRISYVINESSENEETLLIRELSFSLNDQYMEDLTYIKNNPQTYLRLFNTSAFEKYEKMMKEG